MKTIMKIYRYITFILLAALVWSCETPMLVDPDEVPRGIYVMYDPGNTSINSEDIEGTPVTGTFSVPFFVLILSETIVAAAIG